MQGGAEGLVGGGAAQREGDDARWSGERSARRGRSSTVIRAASSSGKPPTPVPSAGNAMLRGADLAGAGHGAADGLRR